jgi:hypothetical protein
LHPTLLAVFLIPAKEIDYVRAHNAARKDHSFSLHRVRDIARNRQLLLFTGCLVLFHFSNASVLPLVSQNLGAEKSSDSLVLISAMMVAPQIIVAAFAPWVGYWSELWGRKPLLLVAFCCETLRALLFATFAGPSWMFAFQLLDGVTGSIMLILTTLVNCRPDDRQRPLQSHARDCCRLDRNGGGHQHGLDGSCCTTAWRRRGLRAAGLRMLDCDYRLMAAILKKQSQRNTRTNSMTPDHWTGRN